MGPYGPGRDVTVDLQVVTDTPEHCWAAVYVAEPLTVDEYKEVAKSIGDEHFRGRFGQVHIFDDEWARAMELPESQDREFTDEGAACTCGSRRPCSSGESCRPPPSPMAPAIKCCARSRRLHAPSPRPGPAPARRPPQTRANHGASTA